MIVRVLNLTTKDQRIPRWRLLFLRHVTYHRDRHTRHFLIFGIYRCRYSPNRLGWVIMQKGDSLDRRLPLSAK